MKLPCREVAWRASIFLGCALCALRVAWAQNDASTAIPTVALTAEQGSPLRLILTKRLRMKQDEPVRARVVEPVYAFDREVVPPGAEVIRRILQLEGVPRPQRLAA